MTEFKCLKAFLSLTFLEDNNGGNLLYRKRCLHDTQRKKLLLNFVNLRKGRSSRSQMFFKVDVLKNFANFTGKHVYCSLFLIKICNFIKKRLQHTCFPVKFAKLLRTPFFTEHFRWLLLEGVCERTRFVKILQSCHFIKFAINHKCFRKMPIKKDNE